jgi:hypothetical protein
MKTIKTVVNLVLCLFLVGSVNAQRSTIVHEQLSTDGHYKFWFEAEDAAVDQLVNLYFQISQEQAVAEFKGSKSHTLAGGVILSMDTEQQELVISYEGTDEEILKKAQGLSHKLTQYLEAPTPVSDGYSYQSQPSPAAGQDATPARNTVAVTNSSNGHYNFHIVVAEDQLADLLTTFTDLSGQQVAADFQGQQELTLEGGIIMSIDTKNYQFMVKYEGQDTRVSSRAKAIGERANAYLGNHGQR